MSPMRFGDMLWEALRAGDSFGVTTEKTRLSAGEVRDQAGRMATVLTGAGCGAGDRVVLYVPGKAAYTIALLGTLAVDATPVPLDVAATSARDLGRVLEETAAVALIGAMPLSGPLSGPSSGSGAGPVTGSALPDGWIEVGAPLLAGVPVPVSVRPDRSAGTRDPDTAIIFYSSGATGRPKGVMFSHEAHIESARTLAAAKREFFARLSGRQLLRAGRLVAARPRRALAAARASAWMTPLSLQGVSGHTVLLQAVLDGAPLVVPEEFTPDRALELLASERVTTFVGTPTMVHLMSRRSDCRPARFPSLLVIGLGAEPASAEVIRRARAAFGAIVIDGYGSTELGGGFLATRVTDSADIQETSVGHVFGAGEVRILDPDGQPVGPGEVGELYCQSSRMMSAYVDGSAPPTIDGVWYATGDLARFGPQGAVQIVGRQGDVIARGGRKFSTRDVEEALRRHPDVADVAVVGLRRAGLARDEATAFVVPRPEAAPLTRQAMVGFLRADFPAFMFPTAVVTVEALPRGRDGKIKKHELASTVLPVEVAEGQVGTRD